MSSTDGHGELQHRNAHTDGSGGSRKSSLATQSTSRTRLSVAEGHDSGSNVEHDDHDLTITNSGHVDFSQILQTGRKYLEHPAGGRRWLSSFELHREGTDVSLLLRTAEPPKSSEGPHSLLPLFAQLSEAWYSVARKKRKAEKLSLNVAFKEQEDFEWLLRYIADYLGIGHDHFDEKEQFQLCNSLTTICQDTSRSSDIDACIVILHVLIRHSTFPKDALREALDMLCAATIILTSPTPALAECVQLLLTGPVRQQAVACLLEFAVTPTVQNDSKKMTCGRGALRQLSSSLELKDEFNSSIIHMEDLVNALYQASKCCIFRYCTEVLRVCHAILESSQHQGVLSTYFGRMLDIVDNCDRTVLQRNTSTRSLTSLPSPDRDQVLENDRQNTKYLGERYHALKMLLGDFERHWSALIIDQRSRTCDFFLDHHKELDDSQASLTVAFFEKQGLNDALGGDAVQRVNKVFEFFIRSTKISVPIRLRAIELCALMAARAIEDKNVSSPGPSENPASFGPNIVDRLLTSLGTEHDSGIVRTTLDALKSLAFCTNEARHFPYAELIFRKLTRFIKTDRESNDDGQDEQIVHYARVLQDVFIESLHRAPVIALKAYEVLLDISGTSTKSRKCRLVALRVLIRIRCDATGMLYMQANPDSQYIAVALCRTNESREGYAQESALHSRTALGSANPSYFAGPKQFWSYPEETAYVENWDTSISSLVGVKGSLGETSLAPAEIRISSWLIRVIECIQSDSDWETCSFIMVHLGAQLFNIKLFNTSLEAIVKLRQVLCTQIINGTFKEPPGSTGLKRSDSALCMFNMLTALIPYATLKSEIIQKGFGDDLVKSFLSGLGGTWDGTSRGCIHALCICSFEIPSSVASLYPGIVSKMSKNMTQSHLTIHILEFLAQVARLPEVHSNFTQDEITMIFGICVQFLEKAREHQASTNSASPRVGTLARHSGLSLRRPPYRASMLQDEALPQYASALAYHTLIFWFLSLKLGVRAQYVSWIVPRLVWKNSAGDETIDEQSQVFIDMMQRTAFSDLGETRPDPDFATDADGKISSSSWIVGLSVITAETAGHTGNTQITKRQASGTTHAIYRQLTAPLPSHHVPSQTEIRPEDAKFGATSMLSPHILLQMVTSAAPTSVTDQPIPLTHDESVTRSLNVFDRIPTVDGHKLGVLYVKEGQTKDTDFLANLGGSQDYLEFLRKLGYTVSLIPPLDYNPQGLEHPRDGECTIAFRDRVTEIVYHVPTLMPNNMEHDPTCNMKKAHVGNCHVVIVFNESGLEWKMENFASQVTFVHVVITPANRRPDRALSTISEFYHVYVLTSDNYPNVTPAADPKVISREMLPSFVRMFALNANVFCQAKVAADSDDNEFPSSWRARLQQIKRLKQRALDRAGNRSAANAAMNQANPPVTIAGRRTPREDRSSVTDEDDKDGALAVQLDFGKWTL